MITLLPTYQSKYMDKKLPLVTIITNTKNRARLISRCIESIQNQTYQNYEHIVADGGTDNTKKIVESYNDPHIIYISIPEGTLSLKQKKLLNYQRVSLLRSLMMMMSILLKNWKSNWI